MTPAANYQNVHNSAKPDAWQITRLSMALLLLFPNAAALVRRLSSVRPTSTKPIQKYLPSFISRKNVHDYFKYHLLL